MLLCARLLSCIINAAGYETVSTLMELILASGKQTPQQSLATDEQLLILGRHVAPVVHCSSWHSFEILVCPNTYRLILFQFLAWSLIFKSQILSLNPLSHNFTLIE